MAIRTFQPYYKVAWVGRSNKSHSLNRNSDPTNVVYGNLSHKNHRSLRGKATLSQRRSRNSLYLKYDLSPRNTRTEPQLVGT